MQKSTIRTTLLAALGLLILLGTVHSVKADDGYQESGNGITAVTLASYTVTPLNNGVRINWSTGSELGTQGFRIKRGPANGPFETVTALGDDATGLIYGQGDVTFGASYERTDQTVLNGETWTYVLFEVEQNGNEVEPSDARRTVTVGIPPTNTSVSVIVNTPGSSTSTTPTATPTRTSGTPTATATRQGTAVPGGAASPTRAQFATVTPTVSNDARPTDEVSPPAAIPTIGNTTDDSGETAVIGDTASRPTTAASTGETVIGATSPDNVALAQDEAGPNTLPPVQEGYPAGEAVPTVESAATQPEFVPTATPVGFAVIGSNQGNTGAENNTSSPATQTNNMRSTLFLWIGFVVALLIFITGVVGTLVLYTRKTG